MHSLQHGSAALHWCSRCELLWFDARELRQFLVRVGTLARSSESGAAPAPPPDAVTCPRCAARTLERAFWRGIPLAFCEECSGILLTDSALAAVRTTWARSPRRAPEFRLPLPEGWDDSERVFLELVLGGGLGWW